MRVRGRIRRYPPWDAQQALPVAYCRHCGAELYRWDPVFGAYPGRLCPGCAAEKQRLEEK